MVQWLATLETPPARPAAPGLFQFMGSRPRLGAGFCYAVSLSKKLKYTIRRH